MPGARGKTTSQAFFDPGTSTVSYVIWDHASRRAAVIDPVLDYAFRSGRTSTGSADRVLAYLRDHDLHLDWILETHAHADHLSGAQDLKRRFGGVIVIGEHIRAVQQTFKAVFNLPEGFATDFKAHFRMSAIDPKRSYIQNVKAFPRNIEFRFYQTWTPDAAERAKTPGRGVFRGEELEDLHAAHPLGEVAVHRADALPHPVEVFAEAPAAELDDADQRRRQQKQA
jgi:hypothetical protein